MNFNFEPYHAVGLIEFGMKRADIRNLLGIPEKSFFRSEASKAPLDKFSSFGFFIYYDESDRMEALEAWSDAKIIFNDLDLFQLNMEELFEELQKIDENLQVDSDGIISLKFGIGAWHPYFDKRWKEPFESIIFFRKGYYEN